MFNKFSAVTLLGLSTFLAHKTTDWEPTIDRNYEYIAKPVKYL